MASAEGRQLVIIGAGELAASSYLPAAAMLGWRTTLIDRDIDRARRLARRHRRVVREVGASIEEAALSPQAGVVIATPARTHAQLALGAVEAGARQVLLEKPPTTSRAEYEELAAAAKAAGAGVSTSFLRRAWRSIRAARSAFDSWTTRYGALQRVSLIDGSPWGWKSMATRERGSEALEEILLDELSHGFDSVFYIAGWEAPVDVSLSIDSSTVWEFRGTATGLFGGTELTLEVTVSRTQVLANAIVFDFERASVAVEWSSAGGVCIRPHGARQSLIEGPAALDSVPQQFANILQGAFTPNGGETTPDLSEWQGPLALISAFREALPGAKSAKGIS